MRLRRSILVLCIPLVACGVTNGGVRFDNPPPEYRRGPDGPQHPSTQEVAIVSFVSDATAELKLNEAQSARIATISSALNEKHAAALAARRTLSVDLARCVDANALDEALLMLDAKNLGDSRAAVAPDDVRALAELHALLDAGQRKAFGAALVARAERLKVDDAKSRLTTWSYDLRFEPAQRAAIEAKLTEDPTGDASARAEHDAWERRLRAAGAAFVDPAFDAEVYLDKEVVETTKARTRRLLTVLRVVLPELTKEQRERAATVIRSDVGLPPRGAAEPK